MDKKLDKQQMVRDRATYSYLDALDSGDIDGIIESLQQAVYDASLDQMLIEAHQAYFQEEQEQEREQAAALAEIETQKIVALEPATLSSRGSGQKQKARTRRMPRWIQVLAAVLILCVLIGSLVTVQALRKQGQQGSRGTPTSLSVCQPYPLRQFTTQNTIATQATLSFLVAVTAISANDAWAVGYTSSAPGEQAVSNSALIEHWDGKSWQIVPSPASGVGNDLLVAVKAVSANDVWAVGYSQQASVSSSGSSSAMDQTLIEHWDGRSWQIVNGQSGPAAKGRLKALAVVAHNDVWAVGFFEGTQNQLRPLLEHWNGANWQTVSLQGKGASVTGWLNSVDAISANDIWAVGQGHNTGMGGLVEHWDGSEWQSEPVPQDIMEFNSVSALSTQNVWVTGHDHYGRALIEHWNGQQWSTSMRPNSLDDLELSAVSASDIWVVGSTRGGDGFDHLLVSHWNGEDWQQVAIPTLLLPYGLKNSVASGIAIYGGQQVWIVGFASDSNTEGGYNSALILGQRSCP